MTVLCTQICQCMCCILTSGDAFGFPFHAVEVEFVTREQLTYIHLREVFHNAAIRNPEVSIRSPPGPWNIGVLLHFHLVYVYTHTHTKL